MQTNLSGLFTRGGAIFTKCFSYCTVVTDIPLTTVQVFLFSIVVYFMFGLQYEAGKFFIFCFTLIGATLATTNMFRSFGNLSPSLYVNQNLMTSILIFMISYCCLLTIIQTNFYSTPLIEAVVNTIYINRIDKLVEFTDTSLICSYFPPSQIPTFWKGWVYHLNDCRYFMKGIITNVLEQQEVVCSYEDLTKFSNPTTLTCEQYFVPLTGYTNTTSDNSWDASNKGQSIAILIAFWVFNVFLVTSFVYLTRKPS
ncbi:hypothetical protein ACTFIY_006509 [Dictyostelium cf. discoideum]